MFYSTVLLAAAAFTGAVTAQSMNETGTGPKIDAGSVTYATRQQWCRIQTQNCPRICDGATEAGGNIADLICFESGAQNNSDDKLIVATINSEHKPTVATISMSPLLLQ